MSAASDPDYVVVRPAADLPAGFLPDELNGRWLDMRNVPQSWRDGTLSGVGEAVAVPTGRFEVRDDGVVAEIYEVRP